MAVIRDYTVIVLCPGAEWDAMSDDQKKMVRQMVVTADGDTRKGIDILLLCLDGEKALYSYVCPLLTFITKCIGLSMLFEEKK